MGGVLLTAVLSRFKKSSNVKIFLVSFIAGTVTEQIERTYRNYPYFAKALAEGDERYNKQCDELEHLEKTGRIVTLSPSKNIKIDTLEKDVEKLGEWYFLGYNDTKERLPKIFSYLNAEG